MEWTANFERGRWQAVEERKRKCRKGLLSHSTRMKPQETSFMTRMPLCCAFRTKQAALENLQL